MDRDYYPAGAYTDPRAPYNEYTPPEKEFTCHVSVTIEKDADVPTQHYREYWERDEDGASIHEIDTEDVNWQEEYEERCYTIPEMLAELKKYVEHDLSMTGKNSAKGYRLQKLLEACEGWELTDLTVEEV